MADASRICEKGGGGVLLPLFGEGEQGWPQGLRAFLYFVGLCWCFLGVAIIADVFMSGIEKVTAKKVRLFNRKTQRYYTFEVWNATVANLTLMALGSSAPEILLNVIDIFAKNFYLEGLGPGTIVGSAAFNLLMIIAVCIIAIPNGQTRRIKEMPVYVVTAIFSVFAYLWLIVILVGISPNVVEVWEGVLTFLFFPLLVFMAFAADKGWIVKKRQNVRIFEGMSTDEIFDAEERVRKEHGKNLTPEQVARILDIMNPERKTKSRVRGGVVAAMTGGKKHKMAPFDPTRTFTLKKLSFLRMSSRVVPVEFKVPEPVIHFDFKSDKYAVMENAGHATVKVVRSGNLSMPCRVSYVTVDGTATAPSDYAAMEGVLSFKADETELSITIPIVDDDAVEMDEEFYVELFKPEVLDSKGEPEAEMTANVLTEKCTVIIVDDDDPGVLSMDKDEMSVFQQPDDTEVVIPVKRKNGGCGKVSVSYRLEEDSALAGHDFVADTGTLDFEDQQLEAKLTITIKGKNRYDGSDRFRVILFDAQVAKLDEARDGGAEINILTVTIKPDPSTVERVDKVQMLLQRKWEKSKIGTHNWLSQFKDAIHVGGDDDDGDGESDPPSKMDYVAHAIALPWKLLFALVPPTDYCGGWACFFCALIMIGFVTMIINDLAGLLGCTLCLPDDITAITFVALGTSLPDTFASKTAALQDPTADASVGNVTGSNSVNVFLGLGLPWMIAAIFWAVAGESKEWHTRFDFMDNLDFLGPRGSSRTQGFVVEAGSLSFSVAVFSSCAVLCIGLLAARRKFCGGELGGPTGLKWASFFFLLLLWFIYIGMSAGQSISTLGGLVCPRT